MKLIPFRPYTFRDSISRSASPPFDTINEELAEELRKEPTNIVNITIPLENGIPPSAILKKWLEDGTLKRIDKDSYIGIIQEFKYNETPLRRLGLIGLVEIFPDDGNVRPHEETFEKPLQGRFELMKEINGQPEPIFMLVSSNKFERVLARALAEGEEIFDFEEPIGVVNRVIQISSPETVAEISKSLEGESAIVADGHHRLGATRRLAALNPNNPFWSSCMSYISSVHDSGLLIAGIHRVVKKKLNLQDYLGKISDRFNVEEITSFNGQESMVLYDGSQRYLKISPKSIPEEYPEKFRSSMVPLTYVLNELLFRECLGFNDLDISDLVEYQHDLYHAVKSVENGEASFAVLMPYWNKNSFIQFVINGDTLPPKSTYFYPKIPSGIAINLP